MLTSAIETVAHQWKTKDEVLIDIMKEFNPKLYNLLKDNISEKILNSIADIVAPYMGATKKFVDFLLYFLPTPPTEREDKAGQHSWKKNDLKKSLRIIYDYRSKALHSGISFPAPMCEPPVVIGNNEPIEVPFGLVSSSMGGMCRTTIIFTDRRQL